MAIDINDRATRPLLPTKRGRGRPRTSDKDRPDQLKAAQDELRRKRLNADYKRVTVWLAPEALQAVKAEMESSGCGQEEAMNNLLIKTA
jgi:hypothetical protein